MFNFKNNNCNEIDNLFIKISMTEDMEDSPYKFGYLSVLYWQLCDQMNEIQVLQRENGEFNSGAYSTQDAARYFNKKSSYYHYLHDEAESNGF